MSRLFNNLSEIAENQFKCTLDSIPKRANGVVSIKQNNYGVYQGRVFVEDEHSVAKASEVSIYETESIPVILLASMRTTRGDTTLKIYTESIPPAEIDRFLKHNGFTGYVELSNHSLETNYYFVYYNGSEYYLSISSDGEIRQGKEVFEEATDRVCVATVSKTEIDSTHLISLLSESKYDDDLPVSVSSSDDEETETLEELSEKLVSLAKLINRQQSKITALTQRVEQIESERQSSAKSINEESSKSVSRPNETLIDRTMFLLNNSVGGETKLQITTEFDQTATSVNGTEYSRWIQRQPVYTASNWIVTELPRLIEQYPMSYQLSSLTKSISRSDRVNLNDTVSLENTESEPLDIILRDNSGNPLIIARVRTGETPVTSDEVESFAGRVTEAARAHKSVTAGIFICEDSVYQSQCLKQAHNLINNSMLLGWKTAYRSIDRLTGYHLCLAEKTETGYRMTLPEI